MRQPRPGRERSLLLLALAALVPLLALLLMDRVTDLHRRQREPEEQAAVISRSTAAGVRLYLDGTSRYLATLAADPAVLAADPPGVQQLLQAARRADPQIAGAFLLTSTGAQIASTAPEVSDPDVASRPWFAETLRSGQMRLGPILVSRETGRTVQLFAQRVEQAGGDAPAVIAISVDISSLRRMVGDTPVPGDALSLLVLRDGTVIGAVDAPERWVGVSLADSVLTSGPADGGSIGSGALPGGGQRVTRAEEIPGTPWTVVTALPATTTIAAVRQDLPVLAVEVALAVVVVVALLYLMLRLFRRSPAAIAATPPESRPATAPVLPGIAPDRPEPSADDPTTTEVPAEANSPEPAGASTAAEAPAASESSAAAAAGSFAESPPLAGVQAVSETAAATTLQAAPETPTSDGEGAGAVDHERPLAPPLARLLAQLEQLSGDAPPELGPTLGQLSETLAAAGTVDTTAVAPLLMALEAADLESGRLARMLVDGAGVESGLSGVELQPVQVHAVLLNATASVVLKAECGSVTIDAPPLLPPVQADAVRLEDTLTLLLACACRRSPAGAPVRISVRPLANAVMICIGDEGSATPADATSVVPARGLVGLEVDAARATIATMAGRLLISVSGEGVSACIYLPAAARPAAQPGGAVAPSGRR